MSTAQRKPDAPARPGDGLRLAGLDGTNPLGFLAALGLLRILDEPHAPPGVRIRWAPSRGTWVPFLHTPESPAFGEDSVIAALSQRLATDIEAHPARILTSLEETSEDPRARRAFFDEVAAGADRLRMDWLCAFASDLAPADAINQLQTTRRDYFFGNLVSVIARTRAEHLRRAIFSPWDYSDALDNQSLHLDPGEDRRHAYQWNKPAGDPDRKNRGGMLGANRLALEAIPLFPSFPEASTLRTVGFTGNRSTNTRWTWPLWSVSLSLPLVRSLLGLALLQKETLAEADVAVLGSLGVAAVYRSRRILVGKTPNFTPAQCIDIAKQSRDAIS